MVKRETGAATKPCPTCDAPLALVELADGATSTVLCRSCYPQDILEVAAEANAPRERGTVPQMSEEKA